MKALGTIFGVAFRNVTRNVKRTTLTALAVFIGLTVAITVRGLLNGLQTGIKDQITRAETGDVQIHHDQFKDSPDMMPLDLNITLDAAFTKQVFSNPEVRAMAGRIVFGGLINNEDQTVTTTYFARGIDSENEDKVNPLMKDNLFKGRMPRPAKKETDVKEIVVTKQLAKMLKLKIGSEIMLTGKTLEGSMAASDVKVVGIFELKLATMNRRMVLMHLKSAQLMLHMGNRVTEIVVDIKDASRSEAVAVALQKMLTGKGFKVQVDAWEEIAKMYSTIMQLQNVVFAVISAVLFILVLTGIINTMLMTVYERVREIGTMMAMGVKRRRVLMMFLFESICIGLIGSVLGVIAGSSIVALLNRKGIVFVLPGSEGTVVVLPSVTPTFVLLSVALALVGALLAALYPAWRASKLRPAEAIRSS